MEGALPLSDNTQPARGTPPQQMRFCRRLWARNKIDGSPGRRAGRGKCGLCCPLIRIPRARGFWVVVLVWGFFFVVLFWFGFFEAVCLVCKTKAALFWCEGVMREVRWKLRAAGQSRGQGGQNPRTPLSQCATPRAKGWGRRKGRNCHPSSPKSSVSTPKALGQDSPALRLPQALRKITGFAPVPLPRWSSRGSGHWSGDFSL